MEIHGISEKRQGILLTGPINNEAHTIIILAVSRGEKLNHII